MWVMPLARWYRTAYINSVNEALGILAETGRSFEVEELCIKALRTDPFDEKIIEYHLHSLIHQGKNAEALEECKKTESMFYDVLGVKFSDDLHKLYNQIQSKDSRSDRTLENLLYDWTDGADFPGAYYCDVSVFKNVYQIESRAAARSGRAVYIVSIDTEYESDSKRDLVMQQLGRVIPANLRKGDLFTRSGPGQYMIMLNNLTYENCKMLCERIVNSLDPQYQEFISGTTIKPVKPIE
jgi:hypothetical protein